MFLNSIVKMLKTKAVCGKWWQKKNKLMENTEFTGKLASPAKLGRDLFNSLNAFDGGI